MSMHDFEEDGAYARQIVPDRKEVKTRSKAKRINAAVQVTALVLLFAVVYFFVPAYVVERFPVEGRSMEDSLYDRESVLVEKISIHTGRIERFDVIVFYLGDKSRREYYIKRVIGLPGETVQIVDGVVLIDGRPLVEDYSKGATIYAGLAGQEITIGSDAYFVLGDNRLVSMDSRYEQIGLVSKETIIGLACFRVWPLNRIGFL